MKALSIRQPWAWAIIDAGKNIENRDWTPRNPGLRFRGEFLIHAATGMTRAEYESATEFIMMLGMKPPAMSELARGGIVGRGRVVDVVREHSSPWFFGPIGLVLADVEPLPFVPLKGALGFFDVPDELVRKAA